MDPLLLSIAVFVATNIDDLFVLAAFFADRRLPVRVVVAGQFLGIFALLATSALAASLAWQVTPGLLAWLGVVPLGLGLWELGSVLRRRNGAGDAEDDDDPTALARRAERHLHSRLLAVAAVTVANGGDNLAAWIPLFTRQPARLLVDGLLFAALTALWCWLGWRLVQWPRLGDALRRHGDLLLAVVLIVLGLLLLGGAL